MKKIFINVFVLVLVNVFLAQAQTKSAKPAKPEVKSDVKSVSSENRKPTYIVLEKVILENVPPNNPEGKPWDKLSNPDIYMTITKDQKVVYYSRNYRFENAKKFPLTFNLKGEKISIIDTNGVINIGFFDADVIDDDFMGGSTLDIKEILKRNLSEVAFGKENDPNSLYYRVQVKVYRDFIMNEEEE